MAGGTKASTGRGRPPAEAQSPQIPLKRARATSVDTSSKKSRGTNTVSVHRSQGAGRNQRNIRQILSYTETSTAKPKDAKIFHFFGLPREVRDKIYHYLLIGINIRFQQYGIKIEAVYLASRPSVSPQSLCRWPPVPYQRRLPSWLTLNKQILLEGVDKFHHGAEFFCPLNYRHFTKDTGKNGVFSLNKAKLLKFRVDCYGNIEHAVREEADQERWSTVTFEKDSEQKLRRIIHGLMCSSSELQEIEIDLSWNDISRSSYWLGSGWSITSAGIGFIDQFPKGLRKATFNLMALKLWGAAGCKEQCHCFFQAIKMEFERIARKLVDGLGQELKVYRWCRVHKKLSDECCGLNCWPFWCIEVTSSAHRRALAYTA